MYTRHYVDAISVGVAGFACSTNLHPPDIIGTFSSSFTYSNAKLELTVRN